MRWLTTSSCFGNSNRNKHKSAIYRKKKGSAEERFSDGDLSLSDYLLIKVEYIEAQIELNNFEVLYTKNRIDLITALGLPIEPFQLNSNEDNRHEKP